jgi:hypothetical protein
VKCADFQLVKKNVMLGHPKVQKIVLTKIDEK